MKNFVAIFVFGWVMVAVGYLGNDSAADLPEEINQAQKGDLLEVLSNKDGKVSIGFHHLKTEYRVELINEETAKVSNGVETHLISVDSIQNYILNDNE